MRVVEFEKSGSQINLNLRPPKQEGKQYRIYKVMHLLPKETRLRILELCDAGSSVAAICEELSVSPQTVRRYRALGNIGFEKHPPKCRDCDVVIADAPTAKYCAKHRALRRSAGLERSHSIITVYKPTDEIDNAIRQVCIERIGSLIKVAKRFRWTIHAVSRRANQLGFERPRRGQVWSREELDFLENNSHLSAVTIYKRLRNKGFKRSESSIRTKLARLNLPRGGDSTAASVALGFGVRYHTVVNWIQRGQLKARRRGGRLEEHGRDWWIIRTEDVRDFVLTNPLAFDIRKVDQLWFVELVSGGLHDKPRKGDIYATVKNEDDTDLGNTFRIAV